MEHRVKMYKYLVPTLHDGKLVYVLIPTLFSEPREGYLNEEEVLNLRDLGDRVLKVNEEKSKESKVVVDLNILTPYDVKEECIQPLDKNYDVKSWIETNMKDDKELLEHQIGIMDNYWGLIVDDMFKQQFHKLVWHYIKSLAIFNPAFYPYMYGASYKFLAKGGLKEENKKHLNELVAGIKALTEGDPSVELKINIEPSESLKKIRSLIEEGIKYKKDSKTIKKEINDYLVSSIGYGEYQSEVVIPDVVYEFYRNEAVMETFGRERNLSYLWKIKGGKNEGNKA
jgi:hypothetical protein